MDMSQYKNIWFTSDLHLGHANIIKWSPKTRPFNGPEDMNEKIIADWNSKVGPDDLVYIIGDVSFMNIANTVALLKCMNGTKILVIGNHDARHMKDASYRDCFLMCKDIVNCTLRTPDGEKQMVVMCHYPMWEFNQMQRGAMHLHGHVHGRSTGIPGRVMDVGYDVEGRLFSWEEIYTKLKAKEVREH